MRISDSQLWINLTWIYLAHPVYKWISKQTKLSHDLSHSSWNKVSKYKRPNLSFLSYNLMLHFIFLLLLENIIIKLLHVFEWPCLGRSSSLEMFLLLSPFGLICGFCGFNAHSMGSQTTNVPFDKSFRSVPTPASIWILFLPKRQNDTNMFVRQKGNGRPID